MTSRCYKHPDIETALRCGRCDRPICVKCVVQHPVGSRCEECAKMQKLPMFDVSPTYWARAVAATVGIGIGGAFGLILVSILLVSLGPVGFYFRWLGLVGVGYLMGSGVSLAVNRKRGRGLQWLVGIGMVITYLVVSPILGLALNSFFGLLALTAAVYVAVTQFRI